MVKCEFRKKCAEVMCDHCVKHVGMMMRPVSRPTKIVTSRVKPTVIKGRTNPSCVVALLVSWCCHRVVSYVSLFLVCCVVCAYVGAEILCCQCHGVLSVCLLCLSLHCVMLCSGKGHDRAGCPKSSYPHLVLKKNVNTKD